MWIHDTNYSLEFWMPLLAQGNVTANSDEKWAIIGYELQSALKLTVGFSKFCCELEEN